MKLDISVKRAGILAPVFAIRHCEDLGIGDTEGVRQMIDWCAANHLSVLQFLPINETGDDNSPYNAISSMAICPTTLFIKPGVIPGLTVQIFDQLVPQDLLKEIQSGSVQYRKVKQLKRNLLQESFNNFLGDPDFEQFKETNKDWVVAYSFFRLLMEENTSQVVWDLWPDEQKTYSGAMVWVSNHSSRSQFLKKIEFFQFVQWLCFKQWSDLKSYAECKQVLLMGDVPFGISRYSADTWSNSDLFDATWSGGCPPEPFFKPDDFTAKWGQNWGIPLYRWEEHRKENFKWWRRRVKGLHMYSHLFRIDHVLGFYRIYGFPWPPQRNHEFVNLTEKEAELLAGNLPHFFQGSDDDPIWAKKNKAQGEEILKVLQEAAGNTLLVAEDLGCVPNYVRPSLTELGIPGFKIPMFERTEPERFYKSSEDYQPLSVATHATHDHLPMAAMWDVWNKEAKEAPNQSGGKYEMHCFLKWIGYKNTETPETWTDELHVAATKALCKSGSFIIIFQLQDWFATRQRFNVPGSASDSNWSERLPINVSELYTSESYQIKSNDMVAVLKETGRCAI